MDSKYASRGRGFTLVELLVALAIFSVVMAGIAIVFNSTLYANNSIRARLENYGEFRGFADFIERDISGAYRSVDLDDRLTFMGGRDRILFVGVSQNFGETDFTLMSYYTLWDPEMLQDESDYKYNRLMRVAVPLPYRAVKAFMQSYPQFETGIEMTSVAPNSKHFFPSDSLLDDLIDAEPAVAQVYEDAAEFLLEIPPGERLFPSPHPDDGADMDHVRALFAVLHIAYGVEYGWGMYKWDPTDPATDDYAPRLDDFELASLIDAGEAGVPDDGPGLQFRYGRIRAADGEQLVDVDFEYSRFPEKVTDLETMSFDWRDGWDARAGGGPPEVVEVTVKFRSKTRKRGEPHKEKFETVVYVPMGFDLGLN